MGEVTKIQWCDHTFNAWIGCEKVSPGCKHCYAEIGTSARVSKARGMPLWGPGSSRQVTSAANWKLPARWNRAAAKEGVRRRVFCSSLSDVFEDRPDLVQPRADLFRLVMDTPHLDWLLLTKRPENADRLWRSAWNTAGGVGVSDIAPRSPWLPNIWLGTTAEDQEHYDLRWPHLASVPAAVRFISHEPATGPLTLICDGCGGDVRAHLAPDQGGCPASFPDWVITGGESGSKARPYEIEWARSIIEQTKGSPIKPFVKQLGAKVLGRNCEHGRDGKPCSFLDPKGGDWSEWPADLKVREWPKGATS